MTVEQAEAALVEHYPRLVRLAYVVLPAGLGKHRRVLTAHRLVQGILPALTSPARQGGAYGLLRQEVLRAAMEFGERGRVRGALDEARLPRVLGLRVHPRSGADQELALYRVLASLPVEARAAYVLLAAEGLGEPEARAVLDAAGAADPRGAVRAAAGVRITGAADPAVGGRLLAAGEFDACTLQIRPTDLLRRRRRRRIGAVAAAAVAAGALLVAVTGAESDTPPYAAAGSPAADPHTLDPASLVRAPAGQWKATTKLDFSAWPARGGRAHDTALLGRALAVWAHPGTEVDIGSTPGTPRTGPVQPPQLLFAGDADNATVVIFFDGLRVVRYAQPRHGSGRAALDFAQVGDAGPTTAAAVLVDRVDGNARFLTAPWVTGTRTRDLFRPGQEASALPRSADGVTDPVPMPGARTAAGAAAAQSCGSTWPALQLRASDAVGRRPFLLTDLGDLTPVHLAYLPPSGDGPSGAPLEATGPQALANWAHGACRLGELRGQGVKSVDSWEFARTPLPESAGEASWTCVRADTWRGPGVALVQFVPPGGKAAALGALAGQQADGQACSGFDPYVMAGVMWKSPAAHWYLLAAAGPGTASITASGAVRASAGGGYLATPAERGSRATLTGRLADGRKLSPLNGD